MAVNAMLRGDNQMLGEGWLPHQPSYAFVDVSTPVFDRVLVIVIPCHILKSMVFPHRESLIIWHACDELLEVIPIFEASEMQSGISFLQHVVIVCLRALLLNPTLDIFVQYTHPKWVVGNVL
jgi:hypothetical protein